MVVVHRSHRHGPVAVAVVGDVIGGVRRREEDYEHLPPAPLGPGRSPMDVSVLPHSNTSLRHRM